jgi:hypothetical protein
VEAVNKEVAPVAVIDFAPLVVSATTSVAGPKRVHVPALVDVTVLESVVPVVQENDVVVKAVVAPVTDSPEPKPVMVMVEPVSDVSGNPKLLGLVVENVIVGVMVKAVLTVFTPSVTTMV